MQPLEENVVQINCLRKNANGSQFAKSSDSVCIETLTSMNQMATAELIKSQRLADCPCRRCSASLCR